MLIEPQMIDACVETNKLHEVKFYSSQIPMVQLSVVSLSEVNTLASQVLGR